MFFLICVLFFFVKKKSITYDEYILVFLYGETILIGGNMYLILSDLKPNNRLQIEYEVEHELHTIKGIVLDVQEGIVFFVTEVGSLITIDEQKILSITRINFERRVSEKITELKNHYQEVYQLKQKLEYLELHVPLLREELYDALFLSKFNIFGAKTRLESSIPREYFSFRKDGRGHEVFLKSNQNDEVEMHIVFSNYFEDYNPRSNQEKIIEVNAPKMKDSLEKIFSFANRVIVDKKDIAHEKESLYAVRSKYVIYIAVTQDNFLEQRKKIEKALVGLR